jgi:hypothetical protein
MSMSDRVYVNSAPGLAEAIKRPTDAYKAHKYVAVTMP